MTFSFQNLFLSVCVHMSEIASRGQTRVSDSLDLELQRVVNRPRWMLLEEQQQVFLTRESIAAMAGGCDCACLLHLHCFHGEVKLEYEKMRSSCFCLIQIF